MSRSGKAILYLIYGAMVAGLVTAIVFSFHSNKTTPTAPQASNSSNNKGKVAQNPPSKPQNSNQSTNQSSGQSSSSSSSQSQSTGSASKAGSTASSQLSNSGPGNTVGLFVFASAVGTLAYRRVLIHRLGH